MNTEMVLDLINAIDDVNAPVCTRSALEVALKELVDTTQTVHQLMICVIVLETLLEKAGLLSPEILASISPTLAQKLQLDKHASALAG